MDSAWLMNCSIKPIGSSNLNICFLTVLIAKQIPLEDRYLLFYYNKWNYKPKIYYSSTQENDIYLKINYHNFVFCYFVAILLKMKSGPLLSGRFSIQYNERTIYLNLEP